MLVMEKKHLWTRKTCIKYHVISRVTSGRVMCWIAILGLLQHFSCSGSLAQHLQSRRLASHDAVWSDCWEMRITVLLSFTEEEPETGLTQTHDQPIACVWHVIWCQCNDLYNCLISVSMSSRSKGPTISLLFYFVFGYLRIVHPEV